MDSAQVCTLNKFSSVDTNSVHKSAYRELFLCKYGQWSQIYVLSKFSSVEFGSKFFPFRVEPFSGLQKSKQ